MDVTSYLLGKQAGGGSTPALQNKSVTITENGTTNVTADTGYDGLSQVEVTTNVSGGGASEYFQTALSYDPSDSRGGLALLTKKLPNTITIANSVTSLNYFLANCIYIEETPTMNTQNITSMQAAFSNCWALTTIKSIDTSNVTNFRDFASGCSELKNIPFLKLDKATNLNSMFENTLSVNKFSDASIDNLLLSLISASSYTGTKKISILDYNVMSADYGFGARVKASQYYQDFLNAGWTIN